MKRIFVWAVGMCAVYGTVSAQLTLEECYRAARENYPLVRQFDLIERTKDFTVENAWKCCLMMNGFRMEMNSAREWYLVGTPYCGDLEYIRARIPG